MFCNATLISSYGNDIGLEACGILSRALALNTSITELRMPDNRLGPEAVCVLSIALEANRSVKLLEFAIQSCCLISLPLYVSYYALFPLSCGFVVSVAWLLCTRLIVWVATALAPKEQ
jgi:hypothetical protein